MNNICDSQCPVGIFHWRCCGDYTDIIDSESGEEINVCHGKPMETKFNVGDRVRISHNQLDPDILIGTVKNIRFTSGRIYYTVELDNPLNPDLPFYTACEWELEEWTELQKAKTLGNDVGLDSGQNAI